MRHGTTRATHARKFPNESWVPFRPQCGAQCRHSVWPSPGAAKPGRGGKAPGGCCMAAAPLPHCCCCCPWLGGARIALCPCLACRPVQAHCSRRVHAVRSHPARLAGSRRPPKALPRCALEVRRRAKSRRRVRRVVLGASGEKAGKGWGGEGARGGKITAVQPAWEQLGRRHSAAAVFAGDGETGRRREKALPLCVPAARLLSALRAKAIMHSL